MGELTPFSKPSASRFGARGFQELYPETGTDHYKLEKTWECFSLYMTPLVFFFKKLDYLLIINCAASLCMIIFNFVYHRVLYPVGLYGHYQVPAFTSGEEWAKILSSGKKRPTVYGPKFYMPPF